METTNRAKRRVNIVKSSPIYLYSTFQTAVNIDYIIICLYRLLIQEVDIDKIPNECEYFSTSGRYESQQLFANVVFVSNNMSSLLKGYFGFILAWHSSGFKMMLIHLSIAISCRFCTTVSILKNPIDFLLFIKN